MHINLLKVIKAAAAVTAAAASIALLHYEPQTCCLFQISKEMQ
jgi:hypothetical protein